MGSRSFVESVRGLIIRTPIATIQQQAVLNARCLQSSMLLRRLLVAATSAFAVMMFGFGWLENATAQVIAESG